MHHVLEIAADRNAVFAAVTDPHRLAQWWTTTVQGGTPAVGAHLQLTFGPFKPRLTVTELREPSLVAWRGVSSHDAWGQRTTIRFALDGDSDTTRLALWHQLGDELDKESVATANFTWGYYLNSLRGLCETGTGRPFDATTPGARVGADPLR